MSALLPILAWCATGALVLDGALRVGPDVFRRIREHPGLVLRFLLVVWVAAPTLALLVTWVLQLRGVGGATLLLMAICPGVPLLLASAKDVSGSARTALVVLLATAVTAPLFIPLWTRIISAVHPIALAIEWTTVVRLLVPAVFAPLLAGFAIRAMSTQFALTLARVTDVVFKAAVAVVLVVQLARGATFLLDVPLRTLLAVMIITMGEALLGYWAGRPDHEDERTTSIAAALGNPALALAIVATTYPGYQAGAIFAAYVLFRALLLIPLKKWLKPRSGRAAQRPATA